MMVMMVWRVVGEAPRRLTSARPHVNAVKKSGGHSRPAGVTWCEVNDRIGYKYPLPQNECRGGRACSETERG